jgi:hypothetical protein
LALDPNDRYPSAAEVLKDLKKVRVKRSTAQTQVTSTKIIKQSDIIQGPVISESENSAPTEYAFQQDPDTTSELGFDDALHSSQVVPGRSKVLTIDQTINSYVAMPSGFRQWLILIFIIIFGFTAGQFAPLLFSGQIFKEAQSINQRAPSPPAIEQTIVLEEPESDLGLEKSATLVNNSKP